MSKGFVFDATNPSTEFEHEGGWKIWLRVCTVEELERIRKETTTKKAQYKIVERQAHRFTWEDVDEAKQSQMIWDYCITAWENVYDRDGAIMPCTPENKIMLMRNSQVFAQFVTSCMKKLNKEEEDAKTESEKN